ncbi:cohesin domain-containing protein [Patescibacteria group bacterium]|nr:cohesin domain-containing protein [Patescibacteria group bacterium]MCL5091979.1 cohesin domain-containing protein [Patescibacteria group bacterium]
MDPQEAVKTNKSLYPLIVLSGIVLLTALVIVVAVGKKFRSSQPASGATATPVAAITSPPKIGSMNLAVKGATKEATVGGNVILLLSATAVGYNIAGYDALVTYDPAAFSFVRAKSLLPTYTVFSFDRKNYLSLTATKNLNDRNKTAMNGTELVELTFKAKKVGHYQFGVAADEAKEKTKLVDEMTNILYPAVNQLTVTVN